MLPERCYMVMVPIGEDLREFLVLNKGGSILSCRLRVAGVRFVRTAPYSPNCVIEDATVRSV